MRSEREGAIIFDKKDFPNKNETMFPIAYNCGFKYPVRYYIVVGTIIIFM